MLASSQLEFRVSRGDLFLTEAAVVERIRREFLIPADDRLIYGGAIYDERGSAALREIYGGYIDVACRFGMPLLLTASTRRCNQETVAGSRFADRQVLRDWIEFLRGVRDEHWRSTGVDRDTVFVGGLLGTRGDAYRPEEALTEDDAIAFHGPQCRALLEAGADFLMAVTLPALSEASGLAVTMRETGLPAIVSFVIDRSGRLLDGTPLSEAIGVIDEAAPPLCYMVNCVHPANVRAGLGADANRGRPTLSRLKGIQANTSTLSPSELDGHAELQNDGEATLVDGVLALRREHGFQIFGGCCGTDAVILGQIAAGLFAMARAAAR